MPLAIEQFLRDLIRSRVLSDDELTAVKADVRAQRLPRDAESLARELVRQGRLTKYQAAAIYQGRTEDLVLGNYVVIDKLAAGRMGFVYKAKRRGIEQTFALKVLPPSRLTESSTARQRFEREIQLHVRLSHPNIVRIHDAGEHHGSPFLVMELVNGQDLSSVVKSQLLSVAQCVDYVLQVARGLAYAHGEGVVHRDVKPANLLLDVSGTVKILDMGLARLEEPEEDQEGEGGRLTLHTQLLGTPHYMAPEQAVDPRNADARADIYSLGCTWFYLLTGRAPYPRESKIDALMAHREDPIPRLPAVREDVPHELDAIFQRMMAKRAEERYQTMADVVADLEAWQQSPAKSPRPSSIRTTVGMSTADASTVDAATPLVTLPYLFGASMADQAEAAPTRPAMRWRFNRKVLLAVGAGIVAGLIVALALLWTR